MSVIDWKNIPLYRFVESNNIILIKVINTKKLVTKESKSINTELVDLLIHCTNNIIVGYEIFYKENYFDLKIVNTNYVILSDNSFRLRKPNILYDDKYIRFFSFKNNNFLFLGKL